MTPASFTELPATVLDDLSTSAAVTSPTAPETTASITTTLVDPLSTGAITGKIASEKMTATSPKVEGALINADIWLHKAEQRDAFHPLCIN